MKRNFLMGAAALAGLVTLSACGGGAGSDANAPAAEETAAAPAAEEPAAPAEGEATDAAATDTAAAGGTMEFASMTTDAAAGERVFALCRSCHVLEEGVNRVGPSLYNIVGRDSGTVEGYSYSEANKNSGVTWTTDVLVRIPSKSKGLPAAHQCLLGIKMRRPR